jgi:CRISPR-associated endonuclease Cas2
VTNCYFVSYDISDAKRLRRVFEILKGRGEHVQFSVFRCELSERGREELISRLSLVINAKEDQVMFVDLGPSGTSAGERIATIGRSYDTEPPGPVVI